MMQKPVTPFTRASVFARVETEGTKVTANFKSDAAREFLASLGLPLDLPYNQLPRTIEQNHVKFDITEGQYKAFFKTMKEFYKKPNEVIPGGSVIWKFPNNRSVGLSCDNAPAGSGGSLKGIFVNM